MSSVSALRVAVLGEYIRSWRVQDSSFWIAQAMRPGGGSRMEAVTALERRPEILHIREDEGIHDYDNVQSSFFISYNKPLRRNVSDSLGASSGGVSDPVLLRCSERELLQFCWPQPNDPASSSSFDVVLGPGGLMKICLVSAFPAIAAGT